MNLDRRLTALERMRGGDSSPPIIFRKLVRASEAGPVDAGYIFASTPKGRIYPAPGEDGEAFEARVMRAFDPEAN